MRSRRQCPNCSSRNVHHVVLPPEQSRDIFRVPYACRKCGESFWLARRTSYYMAVSCGVIVALVAFLWIITSLVSYFDREQKLASVARELEEIVKRAEAKDASAEYKLALKYR